MSKLKFQYSIRRLHRYMGVMIGVQFLLWTLGGLYFSWSDMDEVHGDYDKNPVALFPANAAYISPSAAVDSLRRQTQVDSLAEIRLVDVLGRQMWQITCFEKGHERHHKKTVLADALTGQVRPPLSQEEAVEVARRAFKGNAVVESVEWINDTDGHHEYRENPLPAVAVTFKDARHTTVYVAVDMGTVQKFRNRPWRQFDFLWMLHTMDYQDRDNISNWLLRAFSVLGLLTIASGFTLFFTTRRKRRLV